MLAVPVIIISPASPTVPKAITTALEEDGDEEASVFPICVNPTVVSVGLVSIGLEAVSGAGPALTFGAPPFVSASATPELLLAWVTVASCMQPGQVVSAPSGSFKRMGLSTANA